MIRHTKHVQRDRVSTRTVCLLTCHEPRLFDSSRCGIHCAAEDVLVREVDGGSYAGLRLVK